MSKNNFKTLLVSVALTGTLTGFAQQEKAEPGKFEPTWEKRRNGFGNS